MMFSNNEEKDPWMVARLITTEPAALPYLQTLDDGEWDDSTLASTPSMKRGRATTILRNCGEPSDIIISVDHRISVSKRALRKFWKVLRTIILRISLRIWSFHGSSGISCTSTQQPSLGVMGVIV
jgi:hypothetical protein